MQNFIEEMIVAEKLRFQEARVIESGLTDYWHSTVLNESHQPFSGGFGESRERARLIAVAEFLERSKYLRVSASTAAVRKEWGLDIIPTACGFAAGFNSNNTAARALAEAVERWTMSQWIDEKKTIEEMNYDEIFHELSPAAIFFVSQFKSIRFFKKKVVVDVGNRIIEFSVAFSIGLTDIGIFPGSSATASSSCNWEHALLESFRHLLVIRNNHDSPNIFPIDRIRYYGSNKADGLAAIASAYKRDWTIPNVAFHRLESQLEGKYFVARTILNGWKSWHEGGVSRFLY